jgi:XRE family transcriptional regulator, regulator of sulfur utilization
MSAVTATERRRVGLAFGTALRTALLQCGITQEQLAEASGLDHTFVSLLERGRRTPTIAVAFRLSKALGLSPARLIDDTVLRFY